MNFCKIKQHLIVHVFAITVLMSCPGKLNKLQAESFNPYNFDKSDCRINTPFSSNPQDKSIDSSNVRFVGNWPFGTTNKVVCDSLRKLAFVASGGGVYIFDISDPYVLIKISEKIHTRGFINNFFYQPDSQLLYIACLKAGIEIWDVKNPSEPVKLGYYFIKHWAWDICIEGKYAYIIDYNNNGKDGLIILDVSNSSNPQEIIYDTLSYSPYSICVVDSYLYIPAYVSGYYILKIINVSNPSAIKEVAFCNLRNCARDMFISGNYAYISGDSGISIVDISTLSNLKEVGHWKYESQHCATSIFAWGKYAYFTNQYGMRIVDISNLSNLTEVGYFSGNAMDVFVYGGYAYLADGSNGFEIIDVSLPSTPQKKAIYITPESPRDICISGEYAYIPDGYHNGLRIVDISVPSNPYEVGLYETPDSSGLNDEICISGNYVYIANSSEGLNIIDISNPIVPQLVGYYKMNMYDVYDIFVSGKYAYVVGDNGLHILDISIPPFPQKVCSLYIHNAQDVFVSGNYAYIAADLFTVVDISIPSNPKIVGCLPLVVSKIFVEGNYAYITNDRVRILDISNPANPYEVGYCGTISGARNVFVSGSYAYATDEYGLSIIDVSDVSLPRKVGDYVIPSPYLNCCAYGIFVIGNYAYTVNIETGLQIYENLLNGVEENSDIPAQTTKLEISNNPIFESAVIKYHLPLKNNVSLKLFDISGRVLKTLISGEKKAGNHYAYLDAKDLPVGIYFAKFTAGDYNKTIKLILIK